MPNERNNIEEKAVWPMPVPLLQETAPSHTYPIEALPNIIRDAVISYQEYGQQPLPLIACSALSNVSLACQTLANVARDRLLISPVSIYFLIIACSGERKTGADHTFSQVIRQWETEIREKLMPEVNEMRFLHQAWRAEKEGLLNQIKRKSLKNEPTDELKNHFVSVMAQEPQIPLLPTLFFEDATQEALASHIAHGWASASLWSDEGALVLHGQGMQNNTNKFIALLNRLWDGKSFIAHRKTTRSFTVANRRLTVSIMMQPLILQQMLGKNNGISRQSGFLARSLIAFPKSSMGNRPYKEPPESLNALIHFHRRLRECLDQSLSLDKFGCHQLPIISLSPNAKRAWINFFNNIEHGLRNFNQWLSIKDFASKAAENVVRLAALFHLFSEYTGNISCEDIDRASQIINWHLLETRSILGAQIQSSKHLDAVRLLHWISEKELQETTPRYLQQFSPLREKNHRDNSIQILIENYYLKEIKQNGKTILLVNPKVYLAT